MLCDDFWGFSRCVRINTDGALNVCDSRLFVYISMFVPITTTGRSSPGVYDVYWTSNTFLKDGYSLTFLHFYFDLKQS